MTAVLTAWTGIGVLILIAIATVTATVLNLFDRRHEPWCNHDPAAVVDGVCECGERIDP